MTGDPARTDLRPEDMSWTIRCDDEYAVTAVRLAAPQPSWAFVVQEADRCGCHRFPLRRAVLQLPSRKLDCA